LIHELLAIGPHVTAMPVVYGSGDFAWEVRRIMLAHEFDCLAVPLPPSFQSTVLRGVLELPSPSVAVQRSLLGPDPQELRPAPSDSANEDLNSEDDVSSEWSRHCLDAELPVSYVPIDPCQPVIAAIRTALGDHLPIHFIDMETSDFERYSDMMPDAYALKRLPIERYAAAVLPSLRAPHSVQWFERIRMMAWNLKNLSIDFRKILFVTSILEWPWIRQAFHQKDLIRPEDQNTHEVSLYSVRKNSLYFMLGELPFITDLYETARRELGDEANLNIDGVKELLITARESYQREFKNRARKITPKLLSQILKYARNLTLIAHRLTPQLVDIVTSAQQMAGDGYALQVLETAKQYRYAKKQPRSTTVGMSLDRMQLPDHQLAIAVSRFPGPPIIWKDMQLIPRADKKQIKDWKQKWNPYSQCSWPPEDNVIENFRQTVFDRAREMMGADLVQTEKFTTSIRDGIDIRETVRHWHDDEIHVKILPPTRGSVNVAVLLFDSPADPREYPWRTTWFAEHKDESTLAFYATDFAQQPVGPGICLATYGGAMFIYPPTPIPDIWSDSRLDFATTMEERLLGAACLHSENKHIALVSSAPPGPVWRQLARKFKKAWVHLPLNRFSDSTVQQLRMVHVLNGKEVRSYAANYIRKV
jgi:hypothetical protein